MKYICMMFLLILVIGCEDDLLIDTSRNTINDDISDLTYLNGYFYTTNYDLSGNAGSQVNLLKFNLDGSLDDAYDLGLNGQGYITIANDDQNLYLLSRSTSNLMKYSAAGENAWLANIAFDSTGTTWLGTALSGSHSPDSLYVLYRAADDLSSYRLRLIDKENPYIYSRDLLVSWDFVDTTYHGVYAMEFAEGGFLLLGVDTLGSDILISTNEYLVPNSTQIISDSTVVGICKVDDLVYFSYRDRRISLWIP